MSSAPIVLTIGDLVTDVVVHLDRDPQRGTDTPARITRVRGGSAANVASAVVAAGGSARFVGQVGDDREGAALVDDLEAAGVEAIVTRRGVTGTIVVLVDGTGERSFLTDRAAATQLGSVPPGVLDDVAVVHVPIYSLTSGSLADTTMALIGDAIDRDIPITLSMSSLSILREFGRSHVLSLVKSLRPAIVFANAVEARFVLREHPWFTHAGLTVVTNGGHAARATRPDGSDVRVTPDAVEILDSTGAGDAFTAGFLQAWLSGGQAEQWLSAGHGLAARTLRRAGAEMADESDEEHTSR